MTIQIVIADPHPIMLSGLDAIFRNMPDFAVKTLALDGHRALDALDRFNPDLVIMDLSLPVVGGIELIDAIHERKLKTRPVIFTAAAMPEIVRALDRGVPGLVCKDKEKEFLVHCSHRVHAGKRWLDQDIAASIASATRSNPLDRSSRGARLTRREAMVAGFVSEGLPNKRIASKMSISEGTVKLHLHHIYQKLNLPGRVGLVLHAHKHGLPH